MNSNRKSLILIFPVFFIMLVLFLFYLNPLSKQISKKLPVELTVISKKIYSVYYSPENKTVFIKENDSDYSNRFYIKPDISFADFKDILINWRLKPQKLIYLIKMILESENNLNITDKLTLFPILLSLTPENFIIEIKNTKGKNVDIKRKHGQKISVSLINATGQKIDNILTRFKNANIDVMEIKREYPKPYTKIIINTTKNHQKALYVYKLLNINRETYLDTSKYIISDMELILGKDIQGGNDGTRNNI